MIVTLLNAYVYGTFLGLCRHDSIQGKERLEKEFSTEEEDKQRKDVQRPEEHRALFEGTNTDDHFRVAIKITRGAVCAPFSTSVSICRSLERYSFVYSVSVRLAFAG
jgi:hypothetical protein